MPRSRSRSRTGGKKSGPAQDWGFLTSISHYWQRSYVADYLGFALLFTAYILIVMIVEPFHRMFSLDNMAIQFPHAEVERVPVSWNIAYAGVLPLLILVLWAAIFQPGAHKTHVTVLGFFISLILASFLTDVVKNSVGRPRPDLIARCKPKEGTPPHALVTIDVCTEKDHHTLHDGWRSFPSGHSSFAFSGLGYLALVLAGQMHVFRPHTDLARVLLSLAPLLGAALIAISRCEDYRHDVYDVTTGSILGMFVAYFSYRRYYPELKSCFCDQPFPSRAESPSSRVSRKRWDEEARIQGSGPFGSDGLDDDPEYVPLGKTRGESSRLVSNSSDSHI